MLSRFALGTVVPQAPSYVPKRMKKLLVIIVFIASQSFALAGEFKICLAPIEDATTGQRSLANPTGRDEPYQLSLKIGQIEFVQNPVELQCSIYSDDKRLLVIVTDHGKRKASFFIEPKDYKDGACIWFNPLYATWQVGDLLDSSH